MCCVDAWTLWICRLMFAAFSVGFELSPGLRRAFKALLKKIQGPTRPHYSSIGTSKSIRELPRTGPGINSFRVRTVWGFHKADQHGTSHPHKSEMEQQKRS